MALDAVLLECRRLAHLVVGVAQHLEDADLEPVLGPARALAHHDPVAVLLDHGRRRHPVQRLVAAAVGVHEHGAVGFQHQQARRNRQHGVQPARVDDLAAGDDEAHVADRSGCFGHAWCQAPDMA